MLWKVGKLWDEKRCTVLDVLLVVIVCKIPASPIVQLVQYPHDYLRMGRSCENSSELYFSRSLGFDAAPWCHHQVFYGQLTDAVFLIKKKHVFFRFSLPSLWSINVSDYTEKLLSGYKCDIPWRNQVKSVYYSCKKEEFIFSNTKSTTVYR